MTGTTRVVATLFLLGLAPSGQAQVHVPLTISGNQATGVIELPGGIAADLTLSFEQVVGLTPAALEVIATLVDPLDSSLLARLPDPALSIPAGFPVLLRIEPPAGSALSFSGVVTVSLHTHNLSLDPGLPLSMFSAPLGAGFEDVMGREAPGSYREGATRPGFSEFLTLADLRPIDGVITGKFDRLQSNLTTHRDAMPAAVHGDLQARLDRARAAYLADSLGTAAAELSGLQDAVKAHSGVGIPDVWRAHDPRVNVAGLLRSDAETLKFSLNRKAGS